MLGSVRPNGASLAEVGDETCLGSDGLGLDSVEIVELLLGCEERCGTLVGGLLDGGGPLTFGRVVDHFATA
jgi:hypothetical protein